MPVFTRAAVLRNQFPQARGVAHVDRFHTRNIRAARFPAATSSRAHTQIFRAQVEELLAKGLFDHSGIDTGVGTLSA